MIGINYTLCNGFKSCPAEGVCMSICALNAISEKDGKPVISNECVECGLCIMNCPNEAIKKQ